MTGLCAVGELLSAACTCIVVVRGYLCLSQGLCDLVIRPGTQQAGLYAGSLQTQ